MEIRVVNIPSGKDPDEAARESADIWKNAIKKAVPFYDFLIDSAFLRFGDKEAFAKKKITDEILPVLNKIENTIVQGHYLKLLAEKLNLSEEKINEALSKIKYSPKFVPQKTEAKIVKSHEEIIETNLLALVLQAEDIKSALSVVTNEIDPSDFMTQTVKKIFMELIDHISQNDKFDIDALAKKIPAELVPVFNQAFLVDLSSFIDKDQFDKELKKAVIITKTGILRRKITAFSTQVALMEEKEDKEMLKTLKTQMEEAVTALKQLS
jgi:DNA primase